MTASDHPTLHYHLTLTRMTLSLLTLLLIPLLYTSIPTRHSNTAKRGQRCLNKASMAWLGRTTEGAARQGKARTHARKLCIEVKLLQGSQHGGKHIASELIVLHGGRGVEYRIYPGQAP